MKRQTQRQAIAKLRKIHGRKLDFSKSVYKGSDKRMTVVCIKHGVTFRQQYGDLQQGHVACKKCMVAR